MPVPVTVAVAEPLLFTQDVTGLVAIDTVKVGLLSPMVTVAEPVQLFASVAVTV